MMSKRRDHRQLSGEGLVGNQLLVSPPSPRPHPNPFLLKKSSLLQHHVVSSSKRRSSTRHSILSATWSRVQRRVKTSFFAGWFTSRIQCTEVAPLCRSWVAPLTRSLTNVDKEAFINCNERSNCALDRTGDAGHKACGASFAPKAHRFPRSAAGDARRSGHRWR